MGKPAHFRAAGGCVNRDTLEASFALSVKSKHVPRAQKFHFREFVSLLQVYICAKL